MSLSRFIAFLLFLLSLLLLLCACAALVAMLRALLIPSTLVALETAFGSLVIALLCLVLGRNSWRAAHRRWASNPSTQ